MIRCSLLILSVLISNFLSAQNFNLTEVGALSYPTTLSDIWHYNSGNFEYALVGVNNGFSIVDVTEPSNPVELHFITGPSSTWRDIKEYNGFAYVINETSGGLLIVDMNDVRNAAPNLTYNAGGQLETHHNIWIDEFGFAYVAGHNTGNGGVIILDLNADPWAPPIVGSYDDNYVHDVYVRDNIMYTAEINAGQFRIIDVTEKSNWIVLGQQQTSSTFTHNIWPNDDASVVFTTDEVSGAFIDAYDVSDPQNIIPLDLYQSNPGSGVIPHNAHVLNDYVVISYYRDGVIILDGSNPKAMVEVGRWDTSPALDGSGFNGSWGCTPFLDSGLILASDIENGLVILDPDYQRAGFLEGIVTDGDTGLPLNDVTVELVSTTTTGSSNFLGEYAVGIATSGAYLIKYSKPGYDDVFFNGVNINAGQTNTINVQMFAPYSFAVAASISDDNGNPVEGAVVNLSSPNFNLDLVSDSLGNINLPQVFPDVYEVTIGQWGYVTQVISNVDLNPSNTTFNATLVEGYYDDFSLDFGWIASQNNATTGFWELGEPIGTTSSGSQANPDFDVNNDLGDQCYVTGNGGGNAGSDDIDGGSVLLTSPVFDLTKYVEFEPLVLDFSTWFFNAGGNSPIQTDYFTITLNNGSETEELVSYNPNAVMSVWQNETFDLRNDVTITLTDNMTLILDAGDIDDGHLVEAAFDHFRITGVIDDSVNANDFVNENLHIKVTANPFTANTNIVLSEINPDFSLEIFNAEGKLVDTFNDLNAIINWGSKVVSGIYVIAAKENGKIVESLKVVKN